MKAQFSIDVDIERSLMRITMSGFFESDDIKRLATARADAYKRLRCFPNQHLTLVDIRGMDIQPQDSVGAFQKVLTDPTMASRRLAFIVAKSLARMQIKRAADSRDPGYFVSVEEAEAWLLNTDTCPARDSALSEA